MTTSLFGQLGYKLLTLFVSLVYSFTAYVAPATTDPIEGCKDNGANATIVAWADPQISNYMSKRFQPFDAACEDLANAGEGVDSLLIAGDIAENGLQCEYEYITEKISTPIPLTSETAATSKSPKSLLSPSTHPGREFS